MPHLTLDHSANLRANGDFPGLCKALADTVIAQREDGKPVFPIAGVRVRAIAAEAWCIANGQPDAGYVHGRFAIGAGRSDAAKNAAGDAIFDVMKRHFEKQFASRGLALSLEIAEFSETGTWKHNNLHARFKPTA